MTKNILTILLTCTILSTNLFSYEKTRNYIQHSLDNLNLQEETCIRMVPENKEILNFIKGEIFAYQSVLHVLNLEESGALNELSEYY